MNIVHIIDSALSSLTMLLIITTISIILKLYILTRLSIQRPKTLLSKNPLMFLMLVLIGALFIDFAWIAHILHHTSIVGYGLCIFTMRFSWAFFALQYQALTLFIESLIASRFTKRHALSTAISSLFFIFYIGLAFANINCPSDCQRPFIELIVRMIETIYLLGVLVPVSLVHIFWQARTTQLPRILKQQIKIVVPVLIAPLWFLDMLQEFPLSFLSHSFTTNSYSAATITTLLTTGALYYCAKRLTALRFLNIEEQVQSAIRFDFIDDFKNVLEQLSNVTQVVELRPITQTFFKECFNIPTAKTRLCMRKTNELGKPMSSFEQALENSDLRVQTFIENFIVVQREKHHALDSQTKIIIYDELAFSDFYEPNASHRTVLQFMDDIDADVFLPIYEKQQLIAYIIIERNARPDEFYGNVEHDEMLVFSQYISNIINLLQTRTLRTLVQQEKALKEELSLKHQEINQYKEGIRSFLRGTHTKEIGILFYKNKQFIFGNKAAKELIHVNINTLEAHPLTKALKTVATHVQEYKTPYTSFAHDRDGNKMVIAGVPNLEKNNCILTVYYPEIADIVKRQLDLLNDPSSWDYLLYLETTQSGKLINQLLPGSGAKLLNFKISLLQLALNKKAILLDMPKKDLVPTVEIIHHITLREKLETLNLTVQSSNHDIAIKLFGINPVFGISPATKPLLEQLNDTGTLFIQNIHLLDLETQEYLAEFLRHGIYRTYKSEKKHVSNVRVICSTNQNIQALVEEELFSKTLFQELEKTTLAMPSLLSLTDAELVTLTDGFVEQEINKAHSTKNVLELSPKEKQSLAFNRPLSVQELKERIQQLLTHKSKQQHIYHDTSFDPAYQIPDPKIVRAAQLGKQALKDHDLMLSLWQKFKNQAKIAAFLGVNRSSVNRRCKEFNLG